MTSPIPITIITGFLGSGKTTLILNLIPQLPPGYKLALIKNEFGDVAIDSQLATSQSISGVRELLNGCICCNLVGSLADALATLRAEQKPDRIVLETSGSAFPATLALEINRLARETARGGSGSGDGDGHDGNIGQPHYVLDGVVSVIDVENWQGYEDTSVTARLQAQYTDLVVLNKWEDVGERRVEEVEDRILDLDLEVPTPRVRSDRGRVEVDVLLGLDAKMAALTGGEGELGHSHGHDHQHGHGDGKDEHHHKEVEVVSATLEPAQNTGSDGVDLARLGRLLTTAPKDEVYRIKAVLYALDAPSSSTGDAAEPPSKEGEPGKYILNWAFGRWTFCKVQSDAESDGIAPLLRVTVVTAKYESNNWKKRMESGEFLSATRQPEQARLDVRTIE